VVNLSASSSAASGHFALNNTFEGVIPINVFTEMTTSTTNQRVGLAVCSNTFNAPGGLGPSAGVLVVATPAPFAIVHYFNESIILKSNPSNDGLLSSTVNVFVLSSTVNVFEVTSAGNLIIEGDLEFNSGAGMTFAGLSSEDNATTTVIITQDVFVQFTEFDTTNPTNGSITPNITSSTIDIDEDGIYKISVRGSASNGNNKVFEFRILGNDGAVEYTNLVDKKRIPVSSDVDGFSVHGDIELNAGDTLGFWTANTGGMQDVTIERVSFNVLKIGG